MNQMHGYSGVVQKLLISGNTFLDVQRDRSRENEGFGLVVLCQKCTPRLNHAVKSILAALAATHKAIA